MSQRLAHDAGCTRQLSDALAGTRFVDLPADVVATAKACLLDTLAVTLAGCHDPLVDIVEQVVAGVGSPRQATLLGRGRKAAVPDAALVNGAAAHALDFDDMHIAAAMHPSAPVVPAALAIAEQRGSSGQAFLRALALGIEAALRIGEAVNPAHYRRGWHATATLGRFGAAAAAGALLDLDAGRMVAALGIAGTQAAGLKEVFGTMSKPLHAGQAARDGVLAAFLAERDFTSSERILEGDAGFGAVLAEGLDAQRLLDAWGDTWSLRRILYKPHASSFCTQALIEGVLGLRREHGIDSARVRAVRAQVSRLSMENARIGEPATGMQGKFSLTHAAAQALVYGQATEADFTDSRVAEPCIREVRGRVSVVAGEGLGWPEAVVEIDTTDGRTLREEVDLQRRTESAAEKWQLVVAKFLRIADGRLSADNAQALIEAVGTLERAPALARIVSLTSSLEAPG